jgi:hypothetical protein
MGDMEAIPGYRTKYKVVTAGSGAAVRAGDAG